ncbi:metal-dependent hydrolase [Nocardia transvalensis]|uniref:metal-dependent hydrolase n=1 Tax=Nocardia transvalensis TaxID=37333 RepID=UPI0018946934|nr:metal-dependent hydrolase [Nocardia transvalensis]MBF6331755.1 metal-dependent hydrolase [Nocardia transvalensis]
MKLLPIRTRSRAIDPGEVALHARNVHFDWRDTPLHWMASEPIASHVINALNLLLPEGERMFCQAFSEALPLVKDEKLREQMLGFIGQESMHAETHNGVLDEVLSAHGIEVEPYVRQMEFLFRKTLGPRDGLDAQKQFQTLVERLGFIATLEHFFAFLGDWVLNADLERFDADPNVLDLFRWHGAEEVEHRFVAHDVAEYFDIGYLRRCALMLLVFPIFLSLVLRGTKYLVHQDPSLPNMRYPRLVLRVFGSMWRGALPGVPSLLWSALSVFQPGYTPESVGSTAQAVAYLAKSPAARALAS